MRGIARTTGRRMAMLAAGAATLLACGEPEGRPVEVTVPPGATFAQVVDTLSQRGIVARPTLFGLFARVRGDDTGVKAGRYAFVPGESWGGILRDLTEGRMLTVAMTVPEGLTLPAIAERIAPVSEVTADEVLALLMADSAHLDYELPGPGLEGYLLPETYLFAAGTPIERVVGTMAGAFRDWWTAERRARADSLGYSVHELTTLASIVQAEARHTDEMPLIAAVYHNRLRDGWPLQADPTVLYALGGHRERLLYAAMDSVADHPYNTYTQPGLPPGPIGAPGPAALQATLHPADSAVMYFVASPDGRHVFSRTLDEHNRAVAEMRRLRDTTRAPGSE